MTGKRANTRNTRRYPVLASSHPASIRAMSDVSVATKDASIPEELIQQVVRLIRERLHLHHVGLFLLEQREDDEIWITLRDEARGAQTSECRLRINQSETSDACAIYECLTRMEAGITSDSEMRASHEQSTYLPETRSAITLPLISQGRAMGALMLQSTQENAFSQSDIPILQTMVDQVAIAIESARQVHLAARARIEADKRTQNLALLNRATQVFNANLDLDEVLVKVLEEVRDLLNVLDCTIWLTDFQTGGLVCKHVANPANQSVRGWRLAPGQGIAGWVAQNGKNLVIGDTLRDERYFSGVDKHTGLLLRSLLTVPLIVKGKVIGVLQAVDPEANRFTETDLELMEPLAASAANAIENARLFEQTQYRSMLLQTAAAVSKSAIEILDPEALMQQAVNLMRQRFDLYYVGIFLLDGAGEDVVLCAGTGEEGQRMLTAGHRFAVGDNNSLVGWSTAHGEAALDMGGDAARFDNPSLPKTRSEAALPLRSRGRVIGAMTIQSTQESVFTKENLAVWQTMADQIAVALDNARLFKETQKAIEAAEESAAAAAEANQAKSMFLANMSHELRTPLNAIIGFTRIVKRKASGVLPQKQIDNLDKVLLSATQLLGLINAVLDLSKIEAGRLEVHPLSFNIESLVEICLLTIQPLIRDERLHLLKEIRDDIPMLFTDQDKVRQILLNLLSNAVKFTESGTVTVSARQQQANLVLAVADTGTGIPAEALERIFEEFQQVDGSDTREYGGTGLGLSISRHLAELLGGHLKVESSVGSGSTFTLTIPLNYEALQPKSTAAPSPTEVITYLEKEAVILVIDDDPDMFYLLQEALAGADYRIIGATTGREGLQKARTLRPYAIMLDIMMPTQNGWQILHELKADAETQDIPIIISSVVDNKELGYRLGATDYLIKPFDRVAVQTVLEHIATLKAASRHQRLLVVDDDPLVGRLIRRFLSGTQYDVDTAADGLDALKAIARKRPDVILLDLIMPKLDGFGVIEHLQQSDQFRNIPVIAFTSKVLAKPELALLRTQQNVVRVMEKQDLERDNLIQELDYALQNNHSPHRALKHGTETTSE